MRVGRGCVGCVGCGTVAAPSPLFFLFVSVSLPPEERLFLFFLFPASNSSNSSNSRRFLHSSPPHRHPQPAAPNRNHRQLPAHCGPRAVWHALLCAFYLLCYFAARMPDSVDLFPTLFFLFFFGARPSAGKGLRDRGCVEGARGRAAGRDRRARKKVRHALACHRVQPRPKATVATLAICTQSTPAERSPKQTKMCETRTPPDARCTGDRGWCLEPQFRDMADILYTAPWYTAQKQGAPMWGRA